MTITEFNSLSEVGQAKTICRHGVLLAGRIIRELKVYLFQIERFYVEVYFNHLHEMVQGIHSFENTQELDPYLQAIPLPDFMEP